MSKIIRYILTTILTILITMYTLRFGMQSLSYFIFISIYILYLILNIKDLIRKNKIIDNKKFNILSIISLSIMILIFARTLFDPSFIYNSHKYLNEIKQIENGIYVEETQYQVILYLLQNVYYFIGLILLLLIYRTINMEKQNSKYNSITLTCLLISIVSVIPSIQCLSNEINVISYALITLLLIGTEVFFLIKDNHKKREWPIYLSWLFNLFAIISIIVNIIIN